ncbi:hypothetical protein BDB01DRAFT_833557 [Pilobolus umbonatus]|nr:hypothetical protein BDB01DRAFT_833557 [Pilobolus umbonatus]
MAGNHPKKANEKKESAYNQQRKNSAGGKREIGKITSRASQAAGAAILSAVTSPPTAALFQQHQQSLGTNGLNRDEIVGFLNMRYSDALTAYHDTNLDSSMRPEKYEVQEMAWGKNAWGQTHKEGNKAVEIKLNGW